MALRGSRIKYSFELWWLVGSRGFTIWVSSTSFQKTIIGLPQQPPTEKVLKFNVIFMILSKIFFLSKIQNKLILVLKLFSSWTWMTLKYSEVIFLGLRNLCSLIDLSSLFNLTGLTSLFNLTGLTSLHSPIFSKNFLVVIVWTFLAPK